ncbi:hypothetical protein [Thalassospira profundimaris]|uniref:Uncharacterized protein n=1 Tax=Thalassospira profundimaris TaxID=502049 RepID=A0A367WT15_9PROT|nr:hypothetical protein [Thalassospira profundimaris]RCK44605.1 hypothetical protein TH30_14635 [Thalassospira profundimaris]
MPRLDGMNPILLKTLISLAASNNKSAKGGSLGTDAQLRNRTILYPDEALDLPEWGIAGMPGMILGAAPQTCLFVSDLEMSGSDNASTGESSDTDQDTEAEPTKTSDGSAAGIVSFSLTLKCNPDPQSNLKSCTIVWKLSLPIAGYRDIQTSSSSESVRAPVIHTRMKIRGIERDVEIGLLEMTGLEQPLLIGQDTLGDKFLIRPDRDKKDLQTPTPSVDLNPTESSDPSEMPAPSEPGAAQTKTDTMPEQTSSPEQTKSDDLPHKDADTTGTKDTTPETPLESASNNQDISNDAAMPATPNADASNPSNTVSPEDQSADSQNPAVPVPPPQNEQSRTDAANTPSEDVQPEQPKADAAETNPASAPQAPATGDDSTNTAQAQTQTPGPSDDPKPATDPA